MYFFGVLFVLKMCPLTAGREELFKSKILKRSADPQSVILTKEKYEGLITSVLAVKADGKKTATDYWLAKKYNVLDVGGIQKLIVPMTGGTASVRDYLHIDEMFSELEKMHAKVGHGGRDRMEREAKQVFKNVSRTTITDFVFGCEQCEKKGHKRKGLVVKPIILEHEQPRST